MHFYTLNLEKVVYGITDELGITSNLIEKSNETDAKDMVAVGSRWARTGDTVSFTRGDSLRKSVVKSITDGGAAIVELDGEDIELAKGTYEKVM